MPNTSKNILPHGFKYDNIKRPLIHSAHTHRGLPHTIKSLNFPRLTVYFIIIFFKNNKYIVGKYRANTSLGDYK